MCLRIEMLGGKGIYSSNKHIPGIHLPFSTLIQTKSPELTWYKNTFHIQYYIHIKVHLEFPTTLVCWIAFAHIMKAYLPIFCTGCQNRFQLE